MLNTLLNRFLSPSLYFIHRIDANIGDALCAPYRYYTFARHRIIDICNIEAIQKIRTNASIIIGGGGLMMPYFDAYREAILQRQPNNVVWWGVGERQIQHIEQGYISAQEVEESIRPNWFNSNQLVGFRQTSPYYSFLPCVSCKAVEAYRKQVPKATMQHKVVFFEHNDVPLPDIGAFIKKSNHHQTEASIFAFLDSAQVVVTNSYHGMYWATLLGKQVVVVPFSSGLYHHPWPVHYATPQNLETKVNEVLALEHEPNHTILNQCIELNDAFYKLVLQYLSH